MSRIIPEGTRVETIDCEVGTVLGIGHIQPELTNAGFDGNQTFPETPWYNVKLDRGPIREFDASRLRII